MASAIRSFMLPVGFSLSSFKRMRAPFAGTTRLAPTTAGRALIARLPPILDALRQLEDDVTSSALGLAGVLRVHAPVALGEVHLTRELLRFQKLQPRIELDVAYDDRPVDL